MPNTTSSITTEQRNYGARNRVRSGFTFIMTNDTDEEITDSFFGVGFEGGGGDFITGFKISPRSTWQHSIDVTKCVKDAVCTVYFGNEMLEMPAYSNPGQGNCHTFAGWRVYYAKGTFKLMLQLGIATERDA